MNLFKIKTLGCKINQYESQVIRERLIEAGHQEAEGVREADLCILNTCTVTAKADKESREILRRFIRENPGADVVAAGCYVEKDADTIKAIDPSIRVLNNRDKEHIVALLKDRDCRVPLRGTRNDAIRNTQYARRNTNEGITYFKGRTKAFIKVQDGCNNFCSYCKVPHVRGRSKSRPFEDILKEAGILIRNNYRELVLTGICLGDFGKDLNADITLTRLLKEISSLDGDFRIRLSSIELVDITDELIDSVASSKKVCSHFHIPLQSGDDDILLKMNRMYTSNEFISRVKFIRSIMPKAAVTTDVIIGFPGEGDGNFNNTLNTIKNINPSRIHIFTYSPRKGTKAYAMQGPVSPEEKSRRYQQLKAMTDKFSEEFKLLSLNNEQRVLIETTRDRDTGRLTGYTDTYVRLFMDGPDQYMGQLVSYQK